MPSKRDSVKVVQALLEAKTPADYEKAKRRAVEYAVKASFVAGFQVGRSARARIDAARTKRRKRLAMVGSKGSGRGGAGRG